MTEFIQVDLIDFPEQMQDTDTIYVYWDEDEHDDSVGYHPDRDVSVYIMREGAIVTDLTDSLTVAEINYVNEQIDQYYKTLDED